MTRFLRQHWFLVALVLLMPGGMTLAARHPAMAQRLIFWIDPHATTACVLVLMAFSLDAGKIAQAVRAPGPVLWGCCLNSILAPLLAVALVPWQSSADFGFGLAIVGCVPCTVATASVWTRKARGNDAVSLLITLATNAACCLVIPFWLAVATPIVAPVSATGTAVVTADMRTVIPADRMMFNLALAVLVPTLVGQLLRQPPPLAAWAGRVKTELGVVAQGLILWLVLQSAVRAGGNLARTGFHADWQSVALVWMSCVVVHGAVLGIGLRTSRRFGFAPADVPAVAFAGSQKTLPIGLLVAHEFAESAGLTLAVFPMLMYHVSQLFIDTALAEQLAREADATDAGFSRIF